MDGDRKSWPLIVGITAGVVGGIVAGAFLYNMHAQRSEDNPLRDAEELISSCRDKIKEIETGLESLRHPLES